MDRARKPRSTRSSVICLVQPLRADANSLELKQPAHFRRGLASVLLSPRFTVSTHPHGYRVRTASVFNEIDHRISPTVCKTPRK
jgi:hypothetical protein